MEEDQTAEAVRGEVISNWLSVFGALGILIADKEKKIHRGHTP